MSHVPESWYQLAFGSDYLNIYSRRNRAQARREVEFALRVLELNPGDRVLDLCCGAGRHLGPLREQGLKAVGLDRSRALLDEAARQLGAKTALILGDMRHLPLGQVFTALLSFFTSFGYFFQEKQNQQVIREMARALLPGGRLLLDLMDRESVLHGLEPCSRRMDGTRTIEERRWISRDGLRVEKEVRIRDGVRERAYQESV
ncbi:MAG: class I SAM-dependent methyltransferase, partial [Planctomycetota bacterium]